MAEELGIELLQVEELKKKNKKMIINNNSLKK